MTLAADGPLLITLERAKAMIAATAAWSEISNADKIHFDAMPPADPGPDYTAAQMIAARPLAIIWHDVSAGFRIQVASAAGCAKTSGRIICQFEINTPDDLKNDPSGLAEHINRVAGRLVTTGDLDNPGLWELSNQPNQLFLRGIDVDSYVRTESKEVLDVGDACVFELTLHWGRP